MPQNKRSGKQFYIGQLAAYQTLLDPSVLVCITDVSDSYANALLAQVSGFSTDQLIGQNHSLLKSETHSNAYFKKLWQTLLQGESWQGQICFKVAKACSGWKITLFLS